MNSPIVLILIINAMGLGIPVPIWARGTRPLIGWLVIGVLLVLCWIALYAVLTEASDRGSMKAVVVATANTAAMAAAIIYVGARNAGLHRKGALGSDDGTRDR